MSANAVAAVPEYARIRIGFASSTYFRHLPAPSLDRLASIATLQRCKSGGLLHEAGATARKFWLVLTGGLRVGWSAPGGKTTTVAIIGVGSFYSAGAFVEGALMQAECRAERDTTCAVIDGGSLRALEESDADIRALLPRLMLGRLHAVMSLYADVIAAPLPVRLARRLMSQAMTSCRRSADADVEVRTSQTDLAQMLGASRSKVNQELRNLERAGIVRLGYRRLYVQDLAALCDLAGPRVLPL